MTGQTKGPIILDLGCLILLPAEAAGVISDTRTKVIAMSIIEEIESGGAAHRPAVQSGKTAEAQMPAFEQADPNSPLLEQTLPAPPPIPQTALQTTAGNSTDPSNAASLSRAASLQPEKGNFWRTFVQACRFLWREHKGLLSARAVLDAGAAALPLAIFHLTGKLVDALAFNQPHVAWLAGGIIAAGLATGVTGWARYYLKNILARNLEYSSRRHFTQGVVRYSMAELEDPATSQRITQGRENIYRLGQFADDFSNAVCAAVQTVAAAVMVARFSPIVSLGVTAVTLSSLYMERKIARRRADVERRAADRRRKWWYTSWFTTDPQALKELKQLGKIGAMVERMVGHMKFWQNETLSVEKMRVRRTGSMDLLCEACLGAATGFLVYRAFTGALSVGGLSAALATLAYLRGAASSLVQSIGFQFETMEFLRVIFGLAPVDAGVRGSSAGHGPSVLGRIKTPPTISLRGVSFCYHGQKQPALQDINLEINPGDVIAIVGPNGAGKTTLTNLLMGTYRPTVGTITVNGKDLGSIPEEEWHEVIAKMPQDFSDFPSLTLREGIELGGRNGGGLSAEQAARLTGANRIIENPKKVPAGYEAVSSPEFENGVQLSGGQRQVMAATRTVARDSLVTILDEPASNLDPLAENILLDCLLGKQEVKTRIIVSHRFGTLLRANRIIVMEDGKISGDGPHDKLFAEHALYRRMFLAQAHPYLEGVKAHLAGSKELEQMLAEGEAAKKAVEYE